MVQAAADQNIELTFETKRKLFYLGQWAQGSSQCQSRKLFDLQDDSSAFPFAELNSQFFVRLSPRLFIAWPLHNEAHIKEGYYVEFDSDWNLSGVQQIADVAPGTMRPTPLVIEAY